MENHYGGKWEPQKINVRITELKEVFNNTKATRFMFRDGAGFGRTNRPKYFWCRKSIRPSVPCRHIREYRYVYGAVEPLTGDPSFPIMSYCGTACMNVFLEYLSTSYSELHCTFCDGAAWHKSGTLKVSQTLKSCLSLPIPLSGLLPLPDHSRSLTGYLSQHHLLKPDIVMFYWGTALSPPELQKTWHVAGKAAACEAQPMPRPSFDTVALPLSSFVS